MAFRSTWSPNFDCILRAGNQGIAFSSVTLSVWARLDDTAFDYECIEINNSNGSVFFTAAITVFSGSWAFHITNSAGTRVSYLGPAVSTNTWVHLALTFNGTTMVSYINGVQVDSRAGPAGPYGNWADVQVGPALGYLQDGLFFSRALTAGEIAQLYGARLPRCSTANLELWAPCFPGSGRLDDYSGNNRDFSNGGTPTDPGSTIPLPPVGWGGSRARVVLAASTGTPIAAAGSTVTTGTATLTKTVAITAAGLTQSVGTAHRATDLKATGTTQSTGSATANKAAQLSASGLTQSSGAGATTLTAQLTATGLTRTFGGADVSGSAPPGVSTAVHQWRRNRRGR
jgi:concanavalin A-like lectin/glucanase superfamily protein